MQRFRQWRELNHQGLVEDGFGGLEKFHRAKAIFIVAALAPTLPLMVSDELGYARSWLWYGWAAITIAWLGLVFGLVIWSTARSLNARSRNPRERDE